MENGPKVKLNHRSDTTATVPESFIEQYPSDTDYKKACAGEPHSVYRRKFGDDYIHSGSWVIGVRLTDEMWAQYQKGDLQAFSIGGYGRRIPVQRSAMPKVKIVDLVPTSDV
jgi:hypothetical protein